MAISRLIKESMEGSSWVRAMFERGIELKRKHGPEKVCDFSLGNPDLDPPEAFGRELRKILDETIPQKHGYMPNGGYPDVRAAVAEYATGVLGVPLTGDSVIMTCGAAGALNVALKSILNPGDQVLSSTPYFIDYRAYAENHGGVFRFVPGGADFDLDVSALEAGITPSTAAVVINSPNNPSGRIYPKDTIEALGDMLRRKSIQVGRAIYLVSDEPYRNIVYDGAEVPSVFRYYENSILAHSYSKELSIPGERIGWVAVHPKAEDHGDLVGAIILCTRVLGYVSAPALMQRAISKLLGVHVDSSPYRRRRDLLCDALTGIGYEFTKPEGSFYLFPKTPGGDDLKFVEALQQELILTVPGRGFGTPGYFRIAYCVDETVIKRSISGFERVYRNFA